MVICEESTEALMVGRAAIEPVKNGIDSNAISGSMILVLNPFMFVCLNYVRSPGPAGKGYILFRNNPMRAVT